MNTVETPTTPTRIIILGRNAAPLARKFNIDFCRNETSCDWVYKRNGKWNGFPPKATYDGITIDPKDLGKFSEQAIMKLAERNPSLKPVSTAFDPFNL